MARNLVCARQISNLIRTRPQKAPFEAEPEAERNGVEVEHVVCDCLTPFLAPFAGRWWTGGARF